ncbi:MAG TPA: serine esterase [Terriglobia bacterium]|nr:serine esterase [Terriglobia bacterium]
MNLPLVYLWQAARVPTKQVVVVLHGRGDSHEGMSWLQDALAIDTLNFLLLTAPNRYYTGFSWYSLPPRQLPGILQSRKVLGQVFEELKRSGYAPEQTLLMGFSQGCLLTLEFGARHPDRLAGYIGISGYSYDPRMLLEEMNQKANSGDWLVTHGTQDEILPVENTRAQISILIDGGFRIDYREYRKAHTIDIEIELPEIRDWLMARLPR